MRQQIRRAAIVVLISAGTATAAFAQGSITQNPGRITPGNLTTGQLGPSGSAAVGANRNLGAGDMSNGNWSGTGYGSGTTVFHGTPGTPTGAGATPSTAPDYGTNAGGTATGAGQ
jgi:hypothetical protein